ncbi:MAG TPA: class I SAM-dependent methyltransferase [Pirellulaceae bacterium]|nr:class I SAM-dependent methyltransferase [Pirellulaceae bacterium]
MTDRFLPSWEKALGDRATLPTKGMEIGVFEGRSTLAFVERFLQHPDSCIVAVDRFDDVYQDQFFHANLGHLIATPERPNKVNVRRGDSFDVLTALYVESLTDGSSGFDFIYLDGSHYTWDVFSDLALSFRLLKIGGVLICDDYDYAPSPKTPRVEWVLPKRAIDAFEACYGPKIERLESHERQRIFRRLE